MDASDLPGAQKVLADISDWEKAAGKGVSTAVFAGFDGQGRFLVRLGDSLEPVRALSTVRMGEHDLGCWVVVGFDRGDPLSPIIIGRVFQERHEAEHATPAMCKLDGERLVLQAAREIELRCGEASIVLTQAGKVLIRGNYVLSRSQGANKIKGAFIDIN